MLKFRARYAKIYADLKKSTLLPVVALVTYISYSVMRIQKKLCNRTHLTLEPFLKTTLFKTNRNYQRGR